MDLPLVTVNVFTSVCQEFCPRRGGGVRGIHTPLGIHPPRMHPPRILRDAVNERVVRILLEYILVNIKKIDCFRNLVVDERGYDTRTSFFHGATCVTFIMYTSKHVKKRKKRKQNPWNFYFYGYMVSFIDFRARKRCSFYAIGGGGGDMPLRRHLFYVCLQVRPVRFYLC